MSCTPKAHVGQRMPYFDNSPLIITSILDVQYQVENTICICLGLLRQYFHIRYT